MGRDLHSYTADSFYIHLGKLFYAVAAVDKVVKEEEVDTLKEIVENQWLKFDKFEDEFGTDAAYQIEIIFDWLDENDPEPGEAYLEFEDYYKEHQRLFTPKVKQMIWKTADAIAASYAGKNKSELILLSKLKSLLKN